MAHEPAPGGALIGVPSRGARGHLRSWRKRERGVTRPFGPEMQRPEAPLSLIAGLLDMNTADARRILETALICSPQPLAVRELRVLFDD